jgi:hypothetical protein
MAKAFQKIFLNPGTHRDQTFMMAVVNLQFNNFLQDYGHTDINTRQ